MTPEQACNILKNNDYCEIHLCPMVEGQRHPFANAYMAAKPMYCPTCKREAEDKRAIQIKEAIEVLEQSRRSDVL